MTLLNLSEKDRNVLNYSLGVLTGLIFSCIFMLQGFAQDDSRALSRQIRSDNLYIRLGVEPTASPEEIRTAFRVRIRRVHPDLGLLEKDQADELSGYLNEAKTILTDPRKRELYDRNPSRPPVNARGSTTPSSWQDDDGFPNGYGPTDANRKRELWEYEFTIDRRRGGPIYVDNLTTKTHVYRADELEAIIAEEYMSNNPAPSIPNEFRDLFRSVLWPSRISIVPEEGSIAALNEMLKSRSDNGQGAFAESFRKWVKWYLDSTEPEVMSSGPIYRNFRKMTYLFRDLETAFYFPDLVEDALSRQNLFESLIKVLDALRFHKRIQSWATPLINQAEGDTFSKIFKHLFGFKNPSQIRPLREDDFWTVPKGDLDFQKKAKFYLAPLLEVALRKPPLSSREDIHLNVARSILLTRFFSRPDAMKVYKDQFPLFVIYQASHSLSENRWESDRRGLIDKFPELSTEEKEIYVEALGISSLEERKKFVEEKISEFRKNSKCGSILE